MKKNLITCILIIMLSIILYSCATFKNTKDLFLDSKIEKIGTISLSIPTWSWTNFSENGNDVFNNKLYDKLYKKAMKKYGDNIDLINVVIKDSVGTNVGIHLGSLIGGAVLAYIINDPEKMNSKNTDDINASYGLVYLLTLGKIVNISADVIKKENIKLDDGIFINIDEYKKQLKQKNLTGINFKNKNEQSNKFVEKNIKQKKGLVENYDEFSKISFINNLDIENKFPIDIYIGKKDDSKWLRIIFRYTGEDWIFFDNITIINSNDSSISWKINTFDKSTDVLSNGTVWEYIDILLSDLKKDELKTLLQGNNIKIRLSGQYYNDYIIDEDYASALLEVINAYEN